MNKPLAPADLNIDGPNQKKPRRRFSTRQKLLLGLGGVVVKLGLVAGGYVAVAASSRVTTDNAYVGADSAQVTPLVGGAVADVLVSDTQRVRKGQILVTLDDVDARLAVSQAEAALGQAERRVSGYFANGEGLSAQVGARAADVDRARAQLAAARAGLVRARLDLDRRKALAATGAVSAEELTSAQNAFSQSEAGLDSAVAALAQADATRRAAVGALGVNQALIANSTLAANPEVAAARARLAQARVDLARTVIRAPVDGVVASRQVQLGQRVQAGAVLMKVVPVQEAYVDANFKEGQLAKVHPGQRVELESDLYGAKVKYHGRVEGLAGGSGSAFALIPAQNATGNWIKVVQRVPVRIRLDPAELAAHPLGVGLSMTATVHVAS